MQREWDEFEPRWYFVIVCNESSKKEFQPEPGWPEFAPQAMILAEVMSTTLVLMILMSLCTCNFNFSQPLDAIYLPPEFKPLVISLPR